MECRLEQGLGIVEHQVGSQQVLHHVQHRRVGGMLPEKRKVAVRVADLIGEFLPLGTSAQVRSLRSRLPANQLRRIVHFAAGNGVDGFADPPDPILLQKGSEAQIALVLEKALLLGCQSLHSKAP